MTKMQRNIGIVAAVIVVLFLALPLLINVNSFQPKIESELSSALGRKVEVANWAYPSCEGVFLRRTSASRTTRRSASHPFSPRKA
jgi:hypothetical protein